jgi:NADPH:quinone reductase-like Zn-dependent oxidoreductase
MRAIQVSRFGGPEVLVPVEVPAPVPAPGELLVEVAAAGVNYADTHRTEGSYRGGTELPFIPGVEVVGRTPDGRRMLAPIFAGGGYAEAAVVPVARAVDVPDDVEDGEALALLVGGFWLRPAMEYRHGYHEPLTELLELTATGKIYPLVGGNYSLGDARRAHEDLLARSTTGKLVLRPRFR